MNIISLVPAVLPKTFDDVLKVEKEICEIIPALQIDVVDGTFAAPASWPYNTEEVTPPEEILNECVVELEIDLMTNDPAGAIAYWKEAGAQRFIIHLSSVSEKEMVRLVQQTKSEGYEVGIAVTAHDAIKNLAVHAGAIDFVQCMGIKKIGAQGQKLLPSVYDFIETVRCIVGETPISIDGGVQFDALEKLVKVGVTRIISGSGLLHHPDGIYSGYKKFTEKIIKVAEGMEALSSDE